MGFFVWRGRGEETDEVIKRAETVGARADDTFALLAKTVVRLRRTTIELEQALEELTADEL